MSTLFHKYSEYGDWIALGNNLSLHHIIKTHGLDDLPADVDGEKLLHLQLPSIPIVAADIEVGKREFYLCYSPQHSFLFVLETELAKRTERTYRAQYGANDNYDSNEIMQRIVWLYRPDSSRAKDPVIANHLKKYLPPEA